MAFNRTKAVEYARKWALKTNPAYLRFDNDCTNFVSQVMLTGGWNMKGERSFFSRKGNGVWWYGEPGQFHSSQLHVGRRQNFYHFLRVSKRGQQVSEASGLGLADVVQIKKAGSHVYHTMVVTKLSAGDLLLSYHTSDHLDEPLSKISSRLAQDHSFVFWRISDQHT